MVPAAMTKGGARWFRHVLPIVLPVIVYVPVIQCRQVSGEMAGLI